ncbi:MAG: nickel pincer cofactor biosynthesis protein LarB [Lachnospiraceae bacterium]|nr:nickel pincer cofactor biosynthesis protein LarB [Lachnospiraceae bacterium]
MLANGENSVLITTIDSEKAGYVSMTLLNGDGGANTESQANKGNLNTENQDDKDSANAETQVDKDSINVETQDNSATANAKAQNNNALYNINIKYYDDAKIMIVGDIKKPDGIGYVAVVTGGTSDIPVAEEACRTLEYLGNEVKRVYDVGVAGLHRLLEKEDVLANATVVIAIAGMEGALASVVGGLVKAPVIAVPTSVGYGASFNGLSALLSMLNSCASGVSVVNIDNGFGAAYQASMINHINKI